MSTERPVFVTPRSLPSHLRKQVEDVTESFDPNWLLPPVDGEVLVLSRNDLPVYRAIPDKIQKPEWAKLIKAHGKASAWSLTGLEAQKRKLTKLK
jgi:hypothetical protein